MQHPRISFFHGNPELNLIVCPFLKRASAVLCPFLWYSNTKLLILSREVIMARLITGENDLAAKYPNLASEWNYEKNGNLTPHDVTAGSRKKVWWLCEKGHAYEQSIIKRTNRGYSCPYCSGHKALKGFNDLSTVNPRLAKEWHPIKNGDLTPFDITAGSGKKVWWLCPLGHEYQATIHDRTSDDTRCPICNAKSQTSFPEQAILFYVKKLYPDAINRYKEIFEHSMELDIGNVRTVVMSGNAALIV